MKISSRPCYATALVLVNVLVIVIVLNYQRQHYPTFLPVFRFNNSWFLRKLIPFGNFHQENKIPEELLQITICTLAKNEGRYLDEWITFNKLTGVTRIVYYDDNSNDNTAEVLSKHQPFSIHEKFPPRNCSNWSKGIQGNCASCRDGTGRQGEHSQRICQIAAFKHCIDNYAEKSDWLGFIDVDEFLYPCASSGHQTLTTLLKTINESYSDIHLECFKFGTSYYKKPTPLNESFVRTHTLRAPYSSMKGESEQQLRSSVNCSSNVCQSFGGYKHLARTRNVSISAVHTGNGVHQRIVSGNTLMTSKYRNSICCNHYQYRSVQESLAKARKNNNQMIKFVVNNPGAMIYFNFVNDTDIVKYLNFRKK